MKLSICIPFHFMANWEFFLTRCLQSIEQQTFKDYEVILMKVSTMPITSNRTIQGATGEIIKILYMDDYLATAHSLQEIVDNWYGGWMATGCLHQKSDESPTGYHFPSIHGIREGVNTIGSPSVVAFANDSPDLFDVHMSWVLDIDLYARLLKRYGAPTILDTPNVIIGIHPGQMTNLMTNEEKCREEQLLKEQLHG